MQTNNKVNKHKRKVGGFRGFITILVDEYKTSLMSGLGIGIFACIISLLTIFVIKDDAFSRDLYNQIQNPNKGSFSEWQSTQMWRFLGQSLVQVSMIMTIGRVFQVLRDKSTLDKNRVAFLTNKNTSVTFAKMFADVTIFFIPIFLVITIGLPVMASKGAPIDIELVGKVIAYGIAITVVYAISSIGLKWINTLSISKVKKFIIFASWTLASLGLAIIGGMVIGILAGADHSLNLPQHIRDNQILISLIPIANFLTPLLTAYGMTDIWTIFPMIGMSLLTLIIVWKPFSKLQKTYLTT